MLEYLILGNALKDYIIAFIILALFLGIGRLFSSLVVGILRGLAKKTKTMVDDILIDVLDKPIVFSIFIWGFSLASSYLDFGLAWDRTVSHIIEVMVVIDIIWILVNLVDSLMEHYLMPLTRRPERRLNDQIMPFARKFVKVVIIVIGLIFLIARLGYDVTSLIAGLGIGGLAFALAAQPLLTNLFGGLSIIADKPFQIGDRVRVDQKYEGYVKEIGMRSTKIFTPDDTIIIIPNSIIASTTVENLSSTKENSIRVVFDLRLNYNTSNAKVNEAVDIIKKIILSHKEVVKDVKELLPFVSFNKFTDSALNLNIGYSLNSRSVNTRTKHEINLAIKEQLEKAGIEFAPEQTIYLKKG